MRLPLLTAALLLGLFAFSPRAIAADPYPNPYAPETFAKPEMKAKKNLVPFREDSGLITAEYYLSTGKYSQALSVLNAVLSRHPMSADAYTYRGYAYYRLGDRKKARENFAKAIAINPKHLGANRYIAQSYLDSGNLARALEQMQVIRLTCGDSNCEELDELEAAVNRYKRGQKVQEEAPAEDDEED
ncbi:MAG: tetratricopeptide 2 repeat protein [Alphaproteobacteria bacterium]|jgi:tetratricopeptide (TPR) repeat protein|nr:tetratricopeptide 2 repeat protein [Alphaproteobacteria bacterium]